MVGVFGLSSLKAYQSGSGDRLQTARMRQITTQTDTQISLSAQYCLDSGLTTHRNKHTHICRYVHMHNQENSKTHTHTNKHTDSKQIE